MRFFNKIKQNLIYTIGLLSVTLISCEDDLEAKSFGVAISENFYETPEQAEQALIASYSPVRELYGREFWGTMSSDIVFGDIGTDDFNKGGRSEQDNAPLLNKQTYNIPTSNPILSALWRLNFKGIYFANLVIYNIPNISFEDENRKKEILAEAYFLRAMYCFDLVNSFGGIPIIKSPLKPTEANVPRASKEDSYAFIEEDLKKAITDLPSRFDKSDDYIGRADKGAALALMMRVCLYQNKMNDVETYGEQILTLDYELIEDYATIFEPEGEWSKESIFEINFISDEANALGTGIPLRLDRFVFATDDLLNSFDTNDPRKAATFYSKSGNYHIKKYSWQGNYDKPGTIGRANRNSANNVRLIRLADVYLMYAEAIYNSNPTKAIEYINKIRERARGGDNTILPDLDASLTGTDLLNAIYKERRLELAGEGLRFHDLVRTGRAVEKLTEFGFKENINEIIPIPFTEVSISGGILQQNPGY